MTLLGSALELTRPTWLVGLALLPVLLLYFAWSLVDFPRWPRIVSLTAGRLLLVLLVLALAGLGLSRPTRELFVVFAVDRSLSVGDEARQVADRFVREAASQAGPHKLARLPFATTPGQVLEGIEAPE